MAQNIKILMPEPDRERYDASFDAYLKTSSPGSTTAARHVWGLRKDGSAFPMEWTLNTLLLGEEQLFVGIVKDASVFEIKRRTVSDIAKIQTVKIQVDIIDALFNLTGELIIARNRLNNIITKDLLTKELKGVMSAMNHIIADLQEKVSSARMVPVEEIFGKFPRMVRDIALEIHKEVDLVVEGGETELDKAVLDEIGEPLMHLLRNAVGHGIELPEVRENKRKPRTGVIKLTASRTENQILIEVEDDGAGIDTEAVKKTALKKGYITQEEEQKMQEKDVLALLFKPGFSSTTEVNGLSGRGVGLDVVKTAAEKLGGTVEIAARPGAGTRFSLKLPLAPAIMQTLMIGAGGHVFILPSDIVLETIEIKPGTVKEVGNREVFLLRGEAVPFVKLKDILHIEDAHRDDTLVAVMIRRGDNFIALGVDTVMDQVENIIKPFDTVARTFKGFSGGTILPDGSIALLLDVPQLFGFETLKESGYVV